MSDGSLYETDIVAWVDQQVAELRRLAATTSSNAIDWTHLIEEIESVGRSQVNGVERKLVLILAHLIKVVSMPDSPAVRGWRSEVTNFQRVVRKQFTPSMRQLIDWQEVWSDARGDASASLLEWGDDVVRGLPDRNPLRLGDLTSSQFDVDRVLVEIVDSISASRASAG